MFTVIENLMKTSIRASSYVGIRMTLDDIINICENTHTEITEDYSHREFMQDAVKKHNIKFEEVHIDDNRNVEVCVYIWKQNVKLSQSWNDFRLEAENCDFIEIQECFAKKKGNLMSFMKEFGLHKEVQMITMVSGLL